MAKTSPMTLNVKFGNPGKNVGGTRTLGVKLPDGKMAANAVRSLLCGARLNVRLEIDPLGVDDAAGQEVMEHGEPGIDPIETVADVKGVGMRPTYYAFSLVLPADVPPERVDAMAFKRGKLTCERTGNVEPKKRGPKAKGEGE